jgi:hypothetical protein
MQGTVTWTDPDNRRRDHAACQRQTVYRKLGIKKSYASFALRAKDMAVSPALRTAETAARKYVALQRVVLRNVSTVFVDVGAVSA